MSRTSILASLFLAAACGGGKAKTEPTTPPAAPQATAPPPAAPKKPVTSDPDVPTGADAARDAELAAKVKPLYEAYVNDYAVLMPDGKRAVLVSNRDGLPQLYVAEVGKPEAPAVRLVETKERVQAPVVTYDGKHIVFQADKGADENWSLWRVDLDGKNLTELTPGEVLNRDPPIRADKVPGTIFYSARKKEESASAVYALPVAGGQPRKLFGGEGTAGLSDVARDGKTLLWTRIPSIEDNHLDVVDATNGKARELYPGASGKKASIRAALLSGDARRAFVVTDAGGEQQVLLALDVKTGKELSRYVDRASPTAELAGCIAPRDRSLLACDVIDGNHNEVRILDAATLKPRTDVKLPLGSGGSTAFSDDGKMVVVAWSTPNAPTDLYRVAVATGQVMPLRKEDRQAVAALPRLEVMNARIPTHDGGTIPTHVYLPRDAAAGKKVPVIVNFHGGPSAVATIAWSPLTRFFTSLGYAWVEPNVRGSSGYGRAYVMADNGSKRVESLKDIESTGRWVGQQPWANPARLVIFGGSYGGYSVLVGLTQAPDLWRAGIDLVGVVNWLTFMKSTNGAIREIFATEIGDPEKDKALLEQLSPINHIDKIKSPLFVYAGANDPRVPLSEDDQVVKALRERGVLVEYMVAPDEGHSLDRRPNQLAFASRSARFLEKALGLASR